MASGAPADQRRQSPAGPDGSTQEQYQLSLAAAIAARDDGEVEASAALFETLLQAYPGDPETSLHYVAALKKLRRLDDADQVLAAGVARHPDHAGLRHIWADLPTHNFDHDRTIERGRTYRASFPPAKYPGAWASVTAEYWAFTESLRWDVLRRTLEAEGDAMIRHPAGLRLALWHTNELGLTDHQRVIIAAAPAEAWGHLPPEARGNAKLRMEMALLNRQLREAAQTRIIPLGQNCLPYLLGGRWGLIADRDRAEAMTPFDRGAFQKDSVAAVIATDFADFAERDAFEITGSYDGKRMFRQKATGVYFYHERGTYWLNNDGALFFPHLQRMIANWRRISHAGPRLFVFCLCGAGDLERLLEVMERRLLGPDAHLLIVDVLQQTHLVPKRENVTYIHAPYPAHYAWDDFYHQSSARGVGFELNVVNAIFARLVSRLGGDAAASFKERRRQLLQEAAVAAAARHEHENSVALYGALSLDNVVEGQSVLGYARALHEADRVAEADALLSQAVQRDPANYDLQAARAHFGAARFDRNEKLARLGGLRLAFPPEAEPRNWATLREELGLIVDTGQWDQLLPLIDLHWRHLVSRPELFQSALEALIVLGYSSIARRLLRDAEPAALAALPASLLDGLASRLDQAQANRSLLQRCRAAVLPIGQNGFATMLVARWGLRGSIRSFDRSTPFEFGDFFRGNAAAAIADDFAALSREQDYVEKPAWGGGMTLRHAPTDVAYMVHRNAKIGEDERRRFFSHLDQMIQHWRAVKTAGRRVFLFFRFDTTDLEPLVAAVRQRLFDGEARLVIVDVQQKPASLRQYDNVTLLHAPIPNGYPWVDAIGSATPEGLAYEKLVLKPVIAALRSLGQPELEGVR